MCSVSLITPINFRGGETCGSTSQNPNLPNPTNEVREYNLNFKQQPNYDYYEKEKKSKTKKIIIGTGIALGVTAAGILGLGYLGKTGKVDKIKTEWLKNTIKPVTDTFYKWCKAIKKALPEFLKGKGGK